MTMKVVEAIGRLACLVFGGAILFMAGIFFIVCYLCGVDIQNIAERYRQEIG